MDRYAIATHSGYLLKSAGTNWTDAKLAPPQTHRELDDLNSLRVGNRYTVEETEEGDEPRWDIARSFLRFTLPNYYAPDGIVSATLRLYVSSNDFSNGGEFRLHLLETDYDRLTAEDWDTDAPPHLADEYATFHHTELLTDDDGRDYFDIELTDAQIALMSPVATVAFVLLEKNDVLGGDPYAVGSKWFVARSVNYDNTALIPQLTLETPCGRERIEAALLTTLETINEPDGYSTTPALVTRDRVSPESLNESQCPALLLLSGTEYREELPSNRAAARWELRLLGVLWHKTGQVARELVNRLIDDVDRVLAANPQLGLPANVCQRAWLRQLAGNPALLNEDHKAYCLLTIEAKHTRHLNP